MKRRAKARSGNHRIDGSTIQAAEEVLSGIKKKGPLGRLLPFMGPAFIAAVAYLDPGNFATNIQGGAEFGYTLIWVIVASNLMAMLLQTLSAKLGIATGKNLAELSRERLPRPVSFGMWVLMEAVAMATDLAEFIGAALGFQLLLGVPLLIGGLLTAVIAICYLVETLLDRPDWVSVMHHAVVPRFSGSESVLLAAGILGATVMPHALFLHSALTQGRIRVKLDVQLRRLLRFEIVDVIVAMGVASLVNAAMLIMAAATFHRTGLTHIATIEEAYRTLQPLLGRASSWVFGISLLASGLSSSTVGTSAGQVIMQGFVQRHIPVWLRRAITVVPSLIVIATHLDPTRTLVISQVILSFGLPFAVVPLVLFTAQRKVMGVLVNRSLTTMLAGCVAVLIVMLNVYLLVQLISGGA